MAFPYGWPPRRPTNIRSLRFFQAGTGTANFEDNAFLFPLNHTPTPVIPVGAGGFAPPAPAATPFPDRSPYGGGESAGDIAAGDVPQAWCHGIWIANDEAAPGTTLEISFDGVTVHGQLKAGESRMYRDRIEAGIALRGVAAYRVEAW